MFVEDGNLREEKRLKDIVDELVKNKFTQRYFANALVLLQSEIAKHEHVKGNAEDGLYYWQLVHTALEKVKFYQRTKMHGTRTAKTKVYREFIDTFITILQKRIDTKPTGFSGSTPLSNCS